MTDTNNEPNGAHVYDDVYGLFAPPPPPPLPNKKIAGPRIIVLKNMPRRRLIAGFLAFPSTVLFAVFLAIPFVLNNSTPDLRIMLPVTIVAELLAVLWVWRYAWEGSKLREALAIKWVGFGKFMVGVSLGVSALFVLQLLAVAITVAGFGIESSETSKDLNDIGSTGIFGILLLYVFTPFIVPLVEEVLFRGAILQSFLNSSIKKRTVFWSVLFSTLIFSLAHFQGFSTFTDFFTLFWIACTGTLFALIALKYKSIIPSIGAHMAYNGFTVLFTLLLTS